MCFSKQGNRKHTATHHVTILIQCISYNRWLNIVNATTKSKKKENERANGKKKKMPFGIDSVVRFLSTPWAKKASFQLELTPNALSSRKVLEDTWGGTCAQTVENKSRGGTAAIPLSRFSYVPFRLDVNNRQGIFERYQSPAGCVRH